MASVDDMLREFLEEQRKTQRDGYTVRALHEAVERIATRQLEHDKKDDERFASLSNELSGLAQSSMQAAGTVGRLSVRVGALEKNISRVESAVDDTGRHDVAELERALEAARREADERAERVRVEGEKTLAIAKAEAEKALEREERAREKLIGIGLKVALAVGGGFVGLIVKTLWGHL